MLYVGFLYSMIALPFFLMCNFLLFHLQFVFMCMMVGNDFIPHCPHLAIDNGALSLMLSIYIDLLPVWGGYLTNKDSIHPERFEEFIYATAAYEQEHFARRSFQENEPGFALPPHPEEYYGTHYERSDSWSNNPSTVTTQPNPVLKRNGKTALKHQVPFDEEHDKKVINRFHRRHPDGNDRQSYRDFYYKEKLNVTTRKERRAMVRDYLEGLHWVLHYYHKGCPSWEWFFPHLYSPLATDMVNLHEFYESTDADGYAAFKFEKGKNLSPLAQLLSVLPPQSADLLPRPLAELMLDPNSPLAEYYPKDFTVDQNGKRMSWEAVVKIPFIDSKVLIETLEAVLNDTNIERMLTNGEKRRNVEGEVKLYTPQSEAGRENKEARDKGAAAFAAAEKMKKIRSGNVKRVPGPPRSATTNKRVT